MPESVLLISILFHYNKNMNKNLFDHKTLGVKNFFWIDFSSQLFIDRGLIKQHKYIATEYLPSHNRNINVT